MTCAFVPLLLFSAIGAAIFFVVRGFIAEQKTRAALRAQHPDEPWMWRRDWAEGTAREVSNQRIGFLWFFAIFWNAIALPAAYFAVPQIPRDPVLAVVLIFPAVGIAVLCAAAYGTLRNRKYGQALCRLDRVPVAIGRSFHGHVEARLTEMPENGFQLRLTNLRRIVTGSGKSRSIRENVIWQDEQVVRMGAAPSPNGLRIPFAFRIPTDVEATDDRVPDNRVVWRLEVSADVPGIDYRAQFELPVFQTGGEVDAWTPAVDPRGWSPAADSGIATAGEEVHVKPPHRVRDFVGIAIFALLWFGIFGAVGFLGAPKFVLGIFLFVGLIFVIVMGDYFLGRSSVSTASHRLTIRRTWLGVGRTRVIDAAEIETITPQTGLTSGSRTYWDIEVKLRTGRPVRAAKHIASRHEAEMLAAKLRRGVGR